jgi:hypothetical protein
VAAVG